MRALALLFAVVVMTTSGCRLEDEPPEGVLACATDAECPASWVCRMDDRCYREASPGDDGGVVGVTELCTVSLRDGVAGQVPADEDGDGVIDEGCARDYGVPQFLPPPVPSGEGYSLAALHVSEDGLVLSFSIGPTKYTMTRAEPQTPFEQPTQVTFADFGVGATTYIGDRREAIYVYDDGASLRRAAPALTLSLLPALYDYGLGTQLLETSDISAATAFHGPVLSADGRELLFRVEREGALSGVYHMVRSTRSAEFGAPAPLTANGVGIDALEYGLSPDGLRLYFVGMDKTLRQADRPDPHVAAFGPASEAVGLNVAGAETSPPVFSLRSREAYFASNRSWSTTALKNKPARGLFRVQVCRDGACENPEVTCSSPTLRSHDGLHCYPRFGDATEGYDAIAAGCSARPVGPNEHASMISVLSQAEDELLDSIGASDIYIGLSSFGIAGWQWHSGEPIVYTNWAPNHPGDSYAKRVNTGAGWESTAGTAGLSDARCEVTLFPRW